MNITYNSRALHKSSNANLQPEAIYQALKQAVTDEELILARRSINGENYQWTIPNAPGERWQKLGDTSTLEQEAVMEHIRSYKKKAAKLLGITQEDIDAIFSTPNDLECIYFCSNGDRLRVSIVAWDFMKSQAAGLKGVVTEDHRKMKQEVIIRFVKEGNPVGGVPFVMSLPSGFSKSCMMPENGMFRLGMIEAGLKIKVNIDDGKIIDSFTVTKGQSIYEFDLPVPKPEPEPIEEEEEKIIEEKIIEEEITEDKDEIIEEKDEEKKDEEITEAEQPRRKVWPTLIVMDITGSTVPSFPIGLAYPDGSTDHTMTGADGKHRLPEMTEGDVFTVTDEFANTSTSFTIDPDLTEYVYKLNYTFTLQNQDIKIKIIDENARPVQSGRIALSQEDKTLLINLSNDGIFYLSDNYFKKNRPIAVKLMDDKNNEYSSKSFILEEGEKEYIIQLDTKNCPVWKKLLEGALVVSAAAACVLAFHPLYDFLARIVLSTY